MAEARTGPTLDVGCGALVGLRRQQATRATPPPGAWATPLSQQANLALYYMGVLYVR